MKHELAGIEAYPLAWPLGWKRTKQPRKALYKCTLEKSLEELLGELRLMSACACVISTNVRTRSDGLPRSGLSEPVDRGVAVYWEARDGKPMVMACDTWNTVRGNVRAIGLAISALRMIERTGASQLLERAYTGFAALPVNAGATPWRTTLGVHDGQVTRAEIVDAYRRWCHVAHPDNGGSHELMVRVNLAYAEAIHELEAP